MPYTVKVSTTWNGPTRTTEEQVAAIKQLAAGDFTADGFSPQAVFAMRQASIKSGDLLARGSVISPDGLTITTTNVWKSKAVWLETYQNPTIVAYYKAMTNYGWRLTFTPAVGQAS